VNPEQVAAEVRRIEITTRHLVRDIVAGEYSSAFRGRGVEFAEVREYQPGDDVRTIDWNVTARLGAAYVKRFLEERELTVLFAVDYSASGAFGTRRRTKRALAVEVLAHEPAARGTDLAGSLAALEPLLRRRSVLFLVSDFLAEGWRPVLGRLARRHDVIAVQLVDPRERELPDVGLLALEDAETGAWRWVDTSSPRVRERLRTGVARFDGELERAVEEGGADLLRLDAGEPYGERLLAFFRRRERAQAR
jgi:uncharacterized protein (DUF58 family)